MKSLIIILITVSLFLLSGCYTVEQTVRYYKPVSSVNLPPKPNDYLVPIIKDGKTRRTYKVIGEMEFESGASDQFILSAVQYNARIHGADAVIFKIWEKENSSYVSWYPGWYGYSYDYYACDNGVIWSNYYSAPRYETNYYITNKIKAEMIVFLDSETFGFLGFVFEDVRNSVFLEVGKIIPGSPAQKAGFQIGDRVKKIGDYVCNMGLQDYYENGPIFNVGQNYTIEYERDGKPFTIVLVAEKLGSNISVS